VSEPLRLLAIAGSDSSGRAGLQADLRTFAAHGARGLSAVTAVTAQGASGGVTLVHALPAEVVAAQVDAAFADGPVAAVKVGMLATAANVEVVAAALARRPAVPVVLDPLLAASSGAPLLDDGAIGPLLGRLVPLATLVTPNLPELARLTSLAVEDEGACVAAARRLAGGAVAVLVKGGHGEGTTLVDLLVLRDRVVRFVHPRRRAATRGTGCVLAAAIAARLGRGDALDLAVEGGIDHLQAEIAAATV
jgi:hydroxymethylpyrimidine/phosphomethylpyrimidine kinase